MYKTLPVHRKITDLKTKISQSVLPDGSKRPYTSGRKDNRP